VLNSEGPVLAVQTGLLSSKSQKPAAKRFSDARALRKEGSEQAATNALRCNRYGIY
jgi:hypothetical protein